MSIHHHMAKKKKKTQTSQYVLSLPYRSTRYGDSYILLYQLIY